jgi:hypothetical protein
MPNVPSRCEWCGQTVTLNLPAGLEDIALVGITCEQCADSQVEERGGVVLSLSQAPAGALFEPGKVTITGGAVEALAASSQHAIEFLMRHLQGDWGDCGQAANIVATDEEVQAGPLCTEDDGKVNKLALLTRSGRIMSAYFTARKARLWVITDFWPSGPESTILLPHEY